MTEKRNDLWVALDKLQMDHRAMGVQIVQIRSLVSQIALPDKSSYECPECGITSSSHRKMAEHRYYTHDAEEPAHFALIEARSTPETTDEAPVPGALEEDR